MRSGSLLSITMALAIPYGWAQTVASLTGTVTDFTKAVIPRASAELVSEDGRIRRQAISDAKGVYRFDDMAAGEYRLALQSPGFRSLRVRSIQIGSGEQATLPNLILDISAVCGGGAVLDYIRITKSDFGNLGGRVTIASGQTYGPPIENANVELLCDEGKPCRSTKTNSKGEFLFTNVPPEVFSVRASHPGYYRETREKYVVRAGIESIYYPVYLERCHLGDCSPDKRPKKPISICE